VVPVPSDILGLGGVDVPDGGAAINATMANAPDLDAGIDITIPKFILPEDCKNDIIKQAVIQAKIETLECVNFYLGDVVDNLNMDLRFLREKQAALLGTSPKC